jgi:acetyltransferase-like isoleucine patch superfamily enzyme
MAVGSTVEFLRGKLRSLSLAELVRGECEGWLLTLARPWPGVIGFFLRNSLLRVLLAQKRGTVWVQPGVTVVHPGRIRMGSNVGINSGTYLHGVGGISLGDFVLIGSNVTISSGRHPYEGAHPPIFARPSEPSPIIIEDDVWIGAGAVILPGIRVRRGCVVGANSVVTRDTEEYSIVVGAPARPIGSRLAAEGSSRRDAGRPEIRTPLVAPFER